MTFQRFRYYLYACTAIGGSMALAAYIVWYLVTPKPPGQRVLEVGATAEYWDTTEAAIGIWNGFVGCEFLVMTKDQTPDIYVQAEDVEPCGDPWRPAEEWDHAATAYRCGEQGRIYVAFPGTTHQQASLIGHEIGHILMAQHATRGIMAPYKEDERIIILDKDVDRARRDFCE